MEEIAVAAAAAASVAAPTTPTTPMTDMLVFSCSSCGTTTANFSKRQRKRAEMQSGHARCIPCVDNNKTEHHTNTGSSTGSNNSRNSNNNENAKVAAAVSKTITGIPVPSSWKSATPRIPPTESPPTTLPKSATTTNAKSKSKSAAVALPSLQHNKKQTAMLWHVDGKLEPKQSSLASSSSRSNCSNTHITTSQGTKETGNTATGKRQRWVGAVQKRQRARHLYNVDSSNDDDDSFPSESGSPGNPVSLNALKQKILGRSMIGSMYDDVDGDEDDGTDEYITNHKSSTTHTHSASTVGLLPPEQQDRLRKDLQCAVCHELLLYQPVSLLCGHSFCKGCIDWWMSHQQQQQNGLVPAATASTGQQQPQRRTSGSCPTCRQSVVVPNHHHHQRDGVVVAAAPPLGVNMALRACLTFMFGTQELLDREQAERARTRRATAGERDGAHTRGNAVLHPADSMAWTTLRGKTKRQEAVTARHSVVLDDQDHRMQLALALRTDDPNNSEAIRWTKGDASNDCFIELSVCLLTMEEDEVEDSGFPLVLSNPDDEHWIATEMRFQGIVEALAVIRSGSDNNIPVPIARRSLDSNGVAHFRIHAATVDAKELCFRHCDTGAELHISMPNRKLNKSNLSNDNVENEQFGQQDNVHFVEEQYDIDDDDDSALDRFENDGFVVNSDEEEDDDNEVCDICRDGGDMIVCDGGDVLDGCGRNFHIACIHRTTIPPGDWVCRQCANEIDLDVGVEGHEFVVPVSDRKRLLIDLIDSDDEAFVSNEAGPKENSSDQNSSSASGQFSPIDVDCDDGADGFVEITSALVIGSCSSHKLKAGTRNKARNTKRRLVVDPESGDDISD